MLWWILASPRHCYYCPACRQIWQVEELETVQIATTAPVADLDVYCDTLLTLIHFTIRGIVPVEPWDRCVCHRCGTAFEYRRGTSKLTRSV